MKEQVCPKCGEHFPYQRTPVIAKQKPPAVYIACDDCGGSVERGSRQHWKTMGKNLCPYCASKY